MSGIGLPDALVFLVAAALAWYLLAPVARRRTRAVDDARAGQADAPTLRALAERELDRPVTSSDADDLAPPAALEEDGARLRQLDGASRREEAVP
ncbi:MAG: hypothetical protein QN157_13510 [Armatimonadota bacterium]|nr:hypothetical protein [Armatimonadota bacterium]